VGVLVGELEDVVDEFDAIFGVLFEGVGAVEFLEFDVVVGEVFVGYYLVEHNLLEL
jgi:hypothetical protein